MTRKKAALIFVFANAAIVAVSVLYVLFFYSEEAPVTCRFKETLYMYCPGCGGTRAVYYLLTGNLVRSFISNPAVLVCALIIAYADILAVIALIKKERRIFERFSPKLFFIVLAVLILNFALRNLLLYEFSIDLLGDFSR